MREFAFYGKFTLNRDRLSLMLRCIADGQATSDEAIGAYMGVNPYMVPGFRGWLCKTGLGNGTSTSYRLSRFGELAATHDPRLSQTGTLWILHYHLASQHDERSEVWYQFFNEFATPGKEFTRDEVQTYIEHRTDGAIANKTAIVDDTKELVKEYTQPTAFSSLGLMRKQQKDRYEVGLVTEIPDPHIVAYVLFDSWTRRFPHTDTVRLTQLCTEPETVGRVFVANRDRVHRMLSVLQGMGLINMADTQHEPVTRRFSDSPITFLEQYYQQA